MSLGNTPYDGRTRPVRLAEGSLEKTYHAKVRHAEQRLDKAHDERIIRMHQGEIRNLNLRLERALEELESFKQVSVTYEAVAYGLVQLVSPPETIANPSTPPSE